MGATTPSAIFTRVRTAVHKAHSHARLLVRPCGLRPVLAGAGGLRPFGLLQHVASDRRGVCRSRWPGPRADAAAAAIAGRGNRDDPWFLGEHPGKRDLRTRQVLARGDFPDEVDQRLVGRRILTVHLLVKDTPCAPPHRLPRNLKKTIG